MLHFIQMLHYIQLQFLDIIIITALPKWVKKIGVFYKILRGALFYPFLLNIEQKKSIIFEEKRWKSHQNFDFGNGVTKFGNGVTNW